VTYVPDPVVDRLMRIAEAQAEATGALVQIQQQNVMVLTGLNTNITAQTVLLGRVTDALTSLERDQKEGRAAAVEAVKGFVKDSAKSGDKWIQLLAALIALLAIALSTAALLHGRAPVEIPKL
jgi:hypothetical protein